MKMQRSIAKASAVILALAFATPLAAQTVPGLGDLIGARGSSLDGEMSRRGYEAANNIGAAIMYWNASTRTCASALVDNGRVQSIQPASPADCKQSAAPRGNPGFVNSGDSGNRAAVAQMPRFCKGAAAEKFGQRPQDISTQMPIPDHGMYSVFGQFPPNGAGTVFICTFDHSGKLVGVDRE
jgi:hypothetical protein